MVGRFVEKEQLRSRGEGSRERGAHSPATGQSVQSTRFVPGGESEPVQNPARFRLRGVAVDGFQIRVGGCLRGGVAMRLGSAELGTNRGDSRIAACHEFNEGNIAGRRLLGDGRRCDSGRHINIAAVGFEFTENQTEQAGLARPVRSDHADLLPALHDQVRAIEHLDPAAAELDAAETNHRAAPRPRPPAPSTARCGRISRRNINKRTQFIDFQVVQR